MPPTVQVGAIPIEAWPAMTKLFGIESEPYSGSWSVVRVLNDFALDPNKGTPEQLDFNLLGLDKRLHAH
jgi:hypothetical protein